MRGCPHNLIFSHVLVHLLKGLMLLCLLMIVCSPPLNGYHLGFVNEIIM